MWVSADCTIDRSAEQFAGIWQAREMAVVGSLNEKTDLLLLAVSLRLLRRVGPWVVPRHYVPPFQDTSTAYS